MSRATRVAHGRDGWGDKEQGVQINVYSFARPAAPRRPRRAAPASRFDPPASKASLAVCLPVSDLGEEGRPASRAGGWRAPLGERPVCHMGASPRLAP
eukprot:366205-Chlamydomonas_euryale.AAC.11